ncbi:hypothetical protein ADUPG1_007775 [Aduncisulcus paluster]|uniref:Protein kinase domain-containing protein n=1 Tax=Aduncisulcus paluster TaxID=2918883 RepID=A0ABQ5KSJ6_9EUKA|nr:hypothetical protein ADUPG1_007775 [Aduncisulcus paluster]
MDPKSSSERSQDIIQEVKPEFIHEGDLSCSPIPRDAANVKSPDFVVIEAKNRTKRKDGDKGYDQSSYAQQMMKGERNWGKFTDIFVPFSTSTPIKGAYICIGGKNTRLPSHLIFSLTSSNGEKMVKKYEFPELEGYHWYYLPIDLSDIVLCEITGKGKDEESFEIDSFVFISREETPEEINSREAREKLWIESLIFIKGEDIPPLPSDSTKAIKHDSFTITSSATITPQCIIGHGGFGEVLLVKVDGIPIPCVLKKMLSIADKKVVKDCRKEFKMQRKLFNNPKCFNRIPRPLYILDLLDANMKGVYGFLMEFCSGGSVKDFARSWCVDGKYMREDDVADDSEDSDSSCISDSDSKNDIDTTHFDPMRLNPVKACSLCVGMIECLDDVFRAKKSLVHRDVKPDNFLVRVDPKDGECTVVLSDLGMVQVLDSITSSVTSKSYIPSSSSTKQEKRLSQPKPSACGTIVYNSYETLCEGKQTQKSDGYSLGMSILALFLYKQPFVSLPIFKEVYKKVHIGKASNIDILKVLIDVMENNMCPRLSRSPLFKTLLTIEDGKYKLVHEVLNEVFTDLTKIDEDERMSVHEARKKVQSIKDLLPQIGEGFECPSIEDIVKRQLAKYESGCIEEEMQDTEKQKQDSESSSRHATPTLTTTGSSEMEKKEDGIPSFPSQFSSSVISRDLDNEIKQKQDDLSSQGSGIPSFLSQLSSPIISRNPLIEEDGEHDTQIVEDQ